MDHAGEPLDRDKATFSAFAGRKRALPAGRYTIDVSVTQDDTVLRSTSAAFTVR